MLLVVLLALISHGAAAPSAVAWIYLADGDVSSLGTVPAAWASIPFDKVDRLIIGPLGVQDAAGSFGVKSVLATRFNYVVKRARAQNPSIVISCSQWWNDEADKWGLPLTALAKSSAAIATYASTTSRFLTQHSLAGLVIDYEGSNVVAPINAILRALADALTPAGLVVGLAPGFIENLDATSFALANRTYIQTYAGSGFPVSTLTNLGVPPTAIFTGLCPETNCNGPSLDAAFQQLQQYGLGGIHLWRLNSDDEQHEDAMQTAVFDRMHGIH